MSAYTASYGVRCACRAADQRLRTRDAGQGQHRRPADARDPPGRDVRDLRRRARRSATTSTPTTWSPRCALRCVNERVERPGRDRRRHVAVGARGGRRRPRRDRRRRLGAPRSRQAGRDAGRDRRSTAARRPPAGRRGIQLSSEGLVGVWEEWSQIDLDAVAAGSGAVGRPGAAGGPDEPAPREQFAVEAELDRLEPGERDAARVVPRRPSAERRRAAGDRDPRLQRGADGRRGRRARSRPRPPASPTEVIVVVDGAKDATAERARAAGALVCDVPVNRGQGAALRLGYWLARARGAQVIATIDADGQYEPEELGRVVAADPRRPAPTSSRARAGWAPSSPPTRSATPACSCSAR